MTQNEPKQFMMVVESAFPLFMLSGHRIYVSFSLPNLDIHQHKTNSNFTIAERRRAAAGVSFRQN